MSVPHTAAAPTAAETQIWDIGTSYLFSQALYVAAKLGIADLLTDGPKTGEELAKATEAHALSVRRVLRLLASVGIFIEGQDGRFGLTPAAACLQNGPSSSRALPIWWGEESYHAMGDLLYSVKTAGQVSIIQSSP